MHIFVVIPVFNAGPKIRRTLNSLLEQKCFDGTWSCLVVDGASTDDTLSHVKAFHDKRIAILSEPDSGMYDALTKGLMKAAGEVTCYLPAGEQFDPYAFSIVSHLFQKFPEVGWLTGRANVRNELGMITDSVLPHRYSSKFIDCGMYGTRLSAIQQESTFWRTSLNQDIDFKTLEQSKLAGDFFIWRCFAQKHKLYVVNSNLGSFTIEPNQLSKSVPGAYRKEMRELRRKPQLFEQLAAIALRKWTKYRLPFKKTRDLIWYDHVQRSWIKND